MLRSINIDWLEVYALEDPLRPLDPEIYMERGWLAEVRDYGTRIYKQMYSVLDDRNEAFIEVRRLPKGTQQDGSILPPNACHIRLKNRFCYASTAVQIMRGFMADYNVTLQRVYRIDICMDFERFDTGDDPQRFVRRYIKGKYAKINQSELRAHGKDTWSERSWNSLSWGAAASPVSTKLYNKTLELAEAHDKPYIRQAWFLAGLITDPRDCSKYDKDGNKYKPAIWRLEFSIKSPVKNWIKVRLEGGRQKYQSYRNDLDMYDSPEKLLAMFASLQAHYFHFKRYRYGKSKYECEDKPLFRFSTENEFYKVEHPSSTIPVQNELQRLKKYLTKYRLLHYEPEIVRSCDTILEAIEKRDTARLLANPYSQIDLLALQQTIAARLAGSQQNPASLLHQFAEEIRQMIDKPY